MFYLMGRVGRSPKVSFKFLQTLWAFRTCIYILVYKIKNITNILMGFKIWCQVGGWGTLFSKLPYSCDFSNIWFQKLIWWDGPEKSPLNFFKLCVHLEHIYIYPVTHKSSDGYVKRQGYKLALFGGRGGTFLVGPFFKNTLLHSDLLVTKLSDASIKLHFFWEGG